MNETEKIKTGKTLLRILARNYLFADRLNEVNLEKNGLSKDDVAYSCYSAEGVEAMGLVPETARECINAALIDLEKNYQFKPKLKPEKEG